MKYIAIKTHPAHLPGYRVATPKMNGINMVVKTFNIQDYKNDKACLLAAKKFRNDILKENGCLHLLKARPAAIGMSGTIGVAYHCVQSRGQSFFAYKATWKDNKKQKSTTFSIITYGKKKAYLLACRVRFKHRGTIYINSKKLIPCLPDVDYKII